MNGGKVISYVYYMIEATEPPDDERLLRRYKTKREENRDFIDRPKQ